jgi:hypothetical protein
MASPPLRVRCGGRITGSRKEEPSEENYRSLEFCYVSFVKHPTDSTVLYAGTVGNGAPDALVTKLNSVGSGLLFVQYGARK